MRCIISNNFVRMFGRSIHCLSKIGDEMFFEALEHGLALRTVNSSRSAYACVTFHKTFFYEYEQGLTSIQDSNPDDMLKCKISMKSCLSIFKSLATIEKTVDQCKIDFQPEKCRLVFVMCCKHGITKTHNLTYQECESLQAVYTKELCPNMIVAQSKVLQDTVTNFPNSCEEITLCVCPQNIRIKNYVEDASDITKVVNTEMTLAPEEFDDFQIGIDTEVTFCLKELRAVLSFSDVINEMLTVHFETGGKPIVFALADDNLFEAHFVMATLSDTNDISRQRNDCNRQSQINTVENESNRHKLSSKKKVSPEDSNRTFKEQIVPGIADISDSVDPFFSASCPYTEFVGEPQKSQINSSILRRSILAPSDLRENTEDILMGTPPSKRTKTTFFEENQFSESNRRSSVLLVENTDDEEE